MGAILALLSSLSWGSADFLAGELSRRRAALAVAGAAQIVGLLVMIVVVLASGEAWRDIDPGLYVLPAMAASVCGLGGLVAFYTALASGRMGIVSPIAALGVLVPLGVGLLRGEQPAPIAILGIVLAVVGVVLASGPEISGGTGLRPVVLAVVAAIGFGCFMVFIAIGAQASTVLTMTAQRTTSVLLVLGAVLVARTVGGLQRSDAPRLAAIGVLDVSANLLFGFATAAGLLAVVSVLGSLYPVVTALLAALLLAERLAPAQYVGVAFALAGVAAISFGGA